MSHCSLIRDGLTSTAGVFWMDERFFSPAKDDCGCVGNILLQQKNHPCFDSAGLVFQGGFFFFSAFIIT